MTWLRLLIYGLATWRLSVLLADDSGPYRFISTFRSFLKREAKRNKAVAKSDVAKGVECKRCNSLWFAIPISAYVFLRYFLATWVVMVCEAFFLMLALSAMAIIISRAFPPK